MQSTSLPAVTKDQQKLFEKLLDQVGCAVCLFHLRAEGSTGEIHHLVEGGKRLSHWMVLPLCTYHHRGNGEHGPTRHGNETQFKARYGTEFELIQKCADWINWQYQDEFENEKRVSYETADAIDHEPDVDWGPDSDHDTDTHAYVEPDHVDEVVKPIEVQEVSTRVHIGFVHYCHRLKDIDNYSGKWALDAIVSAGILADDSAEEVETVSHRQEKVPKSTPEYTEIHISQG